MLERHIVYYDKFIAYTIIEYYVSVKILMDLEV